MGNKPLKNSKNTLLEYQKTKMLRKYRHTLRNIHRNFLFSWSTSIFHLEDLSDMGNEGELFCEKKQPSVIQNNSPNWENCTSVKDIHLSLLSVSINVSLSERVTYVQFKPNIKTFSYTKLVYHKLNRNLTKVQSISLNKVYQHCDSNLHAAFCLKGDSSRSGVILSYGRA